MSNEANLPETIDLPELVLLSDEPTPDHDADGLGMRRYAEVIAGAALHTGGPFTIGVYGGWGVGKTSVLRQARSLIETANPESLCVWFNAWQYDHEAHPLVPLALEIAQSVGARIAAEEEAAAEGKPSCWIRWREIGVALRSLASGLTVKAPFVDISAKDILSEFDRLTDPTSSAIFQPGIYQKAYALLRELTERREDESGDVAPPPIVVFIDDLDRCLPRHALRLLQSIRLVLGQPGFVFVLALDREPIVCHLINEYKRLEMRDPDASGPAYLEKIVQLPLWVPPRQAEFAQYIQRLLNESPLKGNPELCKGIENLADALATGTEANPRTLVRLINRLRADQYLLVDVLKEQKNGLGLCAVSRLLRQRLDRGDYLLLVRDQQICDELLGQQEDPEKAERRKWQDLRSKEVESLDRRDTLRRSIAMRLDRTPSIEALLATGIGREWLANRVARMAIESMLAVESVGRTEPAGGDVEIIDAAIRRSLNLSPDTPITAEHQESLTALDLSRTKVTDAGLEHLKGLMSLTALDLSDTQVGDGGLEHLKGSKSLTVLDLSRTQVTDAGLEHLEGLMSLTSLYLSDTQVGDGGLEHLKGSKSLMVLDLSETQVTSAGLEHLKGLMSLRRLVLWGTQVTDTGLESLKELASLMSLDLMGTGVTNDGLRHLGGMQSLRLVDLGQTEISDQGLEHLRQLERLQELVLSETQVTDAGLEHLKGLRSLALLHLSQTQVGDGGLKRLKELEALRRLQLLGTQVTDAGLEYLKGLRSLRKLDVRRTRVTDAGIEALMAAIPELDVFL